MMRKVLWLFFFSTIIVLSYSYDMDSNSIVENRSASFYLRVAKSKEPYIPSSMNIKIFQLWYSLELSQRISFILTKYDIIQYYHDFALLSNSSDEIMWSDLDSYLNEFLEESGRQKFWNACNTNYDSSIDFLEYLVCRNWFDSHGNPSESSEYDRLELVIRKQIEDKLSSSSIASDIFTYDENGIIVD